MSWRWMVTALCALAIVALAAVRVVRRNSISNPSPQPPPAIAVPIPRPPQKPPEPPEPFLGVVVPSETVEVSSKIEGRVKKMNVRLSDHVARGDVLAVIDDAVISGDLKMSEMQLKEAEAEKKRADRELSLAKKKVERRTELSGSSTSLPAVSGEELDIARSNADVAEATVDRAGSSVLERRARVAQLKQTLAEAAIRVPFDGIVAARFAEVGTMLRPGSPVVRLNSTSGLWVRFAVPEGQAGRIQLGERMRVLPIKPVGAAASGEPAAGQEEDKPSIIEVVVEKIAPEVDAASRMIFVEARVDVAAKGKARAVAGQQVHVFHAGNASAHLR